jgi:hypothetical protein
MNIHLRYEVDHLIKNSAKILTIQDLAPRLLYGQLLIQHQILIVLPKPERYLNTAIQILFYGASHSTLWQNKY